MICRTVFAVAALLLAGVWGATAAEPVAVIPKGIIYPGQIVEPHMLEIVPVTNRNIRRDYASSMEQVAGMITRRTLLPGRVIPVSSVREPYAVERGSVVTMVFSRDGLTITAPGSPLNNGMVGDFVRVRNVGTGVTVSGTVMADGTIRVVEK
ncbi:flagellar basal body P-ring formation chaperone FlgA [Hoeflea prorocentri]|uniref:Flagella basal body P-ring formation protein FlgA n=1 Tax=Hoeflea prorocentri TaxID=1922333 RepID=A0A9X3ZJ37_9HYPH|nr:flagellar basal body P-ring formation chaperone FlgA [Hoeflea prorocentri]MCY6382395.1 flagellar basal body P-ring formation chaperone FlgA [Hoeflea prorocentri]MDA5400195.1 flagellar basal body P-ring formation chaperone FlgA [Hoeflea prorocentri]